MHALARRQPRSHGVAGEARRKHLIEEVPDHRQAQDLPPWHRGVDDPVHELPAQGEQDELRQQDEYADEGAGGRNGANLRQHGRNVDLAEKNNLFGARQLQISGRLSFSGRTFLYCLTLQRRPSPWLKGAKEREVP